MRNLALGREAIELFSPYLVATRERMAKRSNDPAPDPLVSAEILQDPEAVFRFDGSDQMPGEVGAGSFWKEMTAWISGQQDLDATLKNIDSSWPSN